MSIPSPGKKSSDFVHCFSKLGINCSEIGLPPAVLGVRPFAGNYFGEFIENFIMVEIA